MQSTPVAAGAQAGNPSVEQALNELQKRLELLRVDATLLELQDCRSSNKRLIAWYQGRRAALAQELGL